MRTRANTVVPRSVAAFVFALAIASLPSLANAEPDTCRIGKTKFEGLQACALTHRIRHGEEVPFRPFEVMGLINEICEALEGRMDERLRNDPRKTVFRTRDGFDCYRKGEPIRLPPMRAANFIRHPLILSQSSRRRR